jgi:excisionase family DNA binding protein
MTISSLAHYLHCHQATTYRLLKTKQIPALKLGRVAPFSLCHRSVDWPGRQDTNPPVTRGGKPKVRLGQPRPLLQFDRGADFPRRAIFCRSHLDPQGERPVVIKDRLAVGGVWEEWANLAREWSSAPASVVLWPRVRRSPAMMALFGAGSVIWKRPPMWRATRTRPIPVLASLITCASQVESNPR